MAYTAGPSKSPYGYVQVHSETVNGTTNNYVHNGGETFVARVPFSASTADAEVLYTVPTNSTVMLLAAFWEVTTGFTGGTSSAIGLSASLAPHTASGDLLGGSSGDVAATLVAGYTQGTVGLSFSAAPKLVVLTGGSTIKFNRITSAFTAGAGYVQLVFMTVGA
jgi:hypothetical protein